MTDSAFLPPAALDSPAVPPDDSDASDFVVVARPINALEAQVIKNLLVAEGIPASLGEFHHAQTNTLWATALGGVRVLVPGAQLARAREAIAAYQGGELALEGDEDPALPRPTRPTDLALWSPDLAVLLSLFLTPLFGATLHFLNARTLGEARLSRQAAIGLVLGALATAASIVLMLRVQWSFDIVFKASGLAAPYTMLWYVLIGHAQSRFVAQSFGTQYGRLGMKKAALVTAMLALLVGFAAQAALLR
jgi:hypothetical protein